MASFGLPITSQASRNALLATKVSRTLQRSSHLVLAPAELEILRRGASLLSEILRGSLLIEREPGQGDLTPSDRGLRALGYALSAAHELKILGGDGRATPVFSRLRDALIAAADDPGTLNAERRKGLTTFFEALAELFRRDLDPQPRPTEEFPSRVVG